jgi:hypothetical protein
MAKGTTKIPKLQLMMVLNFLVVGTMTRDAHFCLLHGESATIVCIDRSTALWLVADYLDGKCKGKSLLEGGKSPF